MAIQASNQLHPPIVNNDFAAVFLRRFAKLICGATLFLIFVGGLVKSTESGLAVPDWPLSYGMLFPPMVGGVFYEHGHRMVAAGVGFLTLCLSLGLGFFEQRRWVRVLGFVALAAVIVQGILGGITVLFFLPTPVSVAHGVLAQTFFVLTIIIAYSLSCERQQRLQENRESTHPAFLRWTLCFIVLVYLQLIAGAVMRHTQSGLAIPDFPTMGGAWIPAFNEAMLAQINDWQFENNMDFVTLKQVVLHFIHRLGAMILLIAAIGLNRTGLKAYRRNGRVMGALYLLDAIILVQITLGIMTVFSVKEPYLTSLHVVTGAGLLGVTVLLFLRAAPVSLSTMKRQLYLNV